MDEQGIIALLQKMVRAPSHPGIPRPEEATVLALRAYLEGHDIPARIIEVRDGRPNLIATLDGKGPGRHLLLTGHTDTVPPNKGSSADLFSATLANGRMFGRGTVDMKGALAAMAGALVEIRESGGLDTGRVTLAAVIDEELESLGTEALIKSGFRADGAVVGEATGNRVAIGHKGLEWLEARFFGRAVHGSVREEGIDAIAAAAHFVSLIESELIPEFARRPDPLLGPSAINVGTIHGGQQPSIVPDECKVQVDRRWVSTETIEEVFAGLEALLTKVRAARPGLRTELARMPEGMATMLHGPLVIDAGHPLVRAAQDALSASGQDSSPTTFPAWTDGALLSLEASIPTVIWGPGDLKLAHSAEESVAVDEILLASRLYADAARRFNGVGPQE
ncbi:MAG TPA: M20 family metallopeptidase [Candidatus Bathyarchaeia archaeon]|nr:M20 family metallopeptidase [Candidatus Bathyarchaeia archaeon]